MTRLAALRLDATAVDSGEWINPGDEFDGMLLKVRGFTDQYFDAFNRRNRRAAVPFNGDVAKIPNASARAIRAECLRDFVFLDVRGLQDDNGADVTADGFRALMVDPDYGSLVLAVQAAAAQVGRGLALDAEEAAKN